MTAALLDPILGATSAGELVTDPARTDLYRHDVYATGPAPLAVLRPTSVESLARGVGAATAAGIAIVPRGGGLSYTGGYLGPDAPFVLVDTAALTQIIDINETDMTVTVECAAVARASCR